MASTDSQHHRYLSLHVCQDETESGERATSCAMNV